MKAFVRLAAVIFMMTSPLSLASNTDGITVSHYESLQRLKYHDNGTAVSQKPRAAGTMTLSFDALGQSFDLQLERNDALLAPEARAALPDSVQLYRGRIAGTPGSWTRLVIADGMPSGLIWDGSQMIAIEAPGSSVVNTTTPVIFRLADTVIAPNTMSCGDAAVAVNGSEIYKTLTAELGNAVSRGPGAVTEISVGAIGDFEFTSAMGAGANAAIMTRLNNVDGIFSQQLGVQITVQTPETFPNSNDPFSDTTDSGNLLDELGVYRRNTPAQNSQGLTHLFTGRDLDEMTVGIAYTGALCSSRFGAGLSEGKRGAVIDSLIAAHEIGHNFGAPHDGDADFACAAEPETFLMAPSINGSNQFSQCSVREMQDDIAAATCIAPLPSIDMTIGLSGQVPAALLGNRIVVEFDATNNGTLQATNVNADITLPNNITFLSAATTSGTCTSGAGTVSCALGNVAGNSGATITVSANATAVGTGTVAATVTSDADDNPGNNQSSVQLTVEPGVDLTVTPPAAAQIAVGQSTTINTVLRNLSDTAANGVTLTVSVDNGLRVDSANLSIGTCTVTAQQVECSANTFGAQTTSTLDIGFTGTTSGTRSYTVTLASTEADSAPSDNTASGSVTVSDNSGGAGGGGGDDSGGGGASGLIALWLLLAGSWLSRRQRGACISMTSPALNTRIETRSPCRISSSF